MAKTSEEIIVKIDADTKEFISGTKKVVDVIKEVDEATGKLKTTTKETTKTFGKKNTTVEKTKTTYKDLVPEVKKTNSAFGGLTKTMVSVAKSFLAYRVVGLMKDALVSVVKINAEFEISMQKVRAITGATDAQFLELTNSAKELALGTMFTASQVSELQLAYSKLGFSTEEILNATEATLNLATITGDSLAGAADVAGATLRGFGLDAKNTEEVIDVMAKSFTSSALNLEHFKQSMKTLAPVASAANVDLQTTTALLGVLADSGLRGTLAATGLKNIMAELVDPTSELTAHLGYTAKNSEGLLMAFSELGEEGIDLAIAAGLIDKRARPAFVTLANGVKDVEALKKSLDNANGSAKKMADTIEDTLVISWEKFVSSVKGFVLQEGSGLVKSLKTLLDVITDWANGNNDLYNSQQKYNEALEEYNMNIKLAKTPLEELIDLNKKTGKEIIEIEKNISILNGQVVPYISNLEEWQKIAIDNAIASGDLNEEALKSAGIFDENARSLILEKDELVKSKEAKEKLNSETRTEILLLQKLKLEDPKAFLESQLKSLELRKSKVNALGDEYKELEVRIKNVRSQLDKFKESPTGDIDVSELYDSLNKWVKEFDKIQSKALSPMKRLEYEKATKDANARMLKDDISVNEQLVKNNEWYRTALMETEEFMAKTPEERAKIMAEISLKNLKIQEDTQKKLDKSNKDGLDQFSKNSEDTVDEIIAQQERWLKSFNSIMSEASMMIDAFNQLFAVSQQNRLFEIEEQNRKDLENFTSNQDEKLRKEQIYQDEESALFIGSQEEKAIFERQQKLEMLEFEKRQEEAREKLREKQLKKENEIAKKIFKVDKANSIAQVAIQTALGIAQINANPVVNADLSQGLRIALTSMISATGAAQIAAIGSQKYQPKTFEDGGMIVGPSHSEGGVPFTVGGRGGFEAEGGEFIMSRKSVDRLGVGFLNALNSGQTMFRDGGVVPSSVISGASAPMNNFMASLDARFAQLENIMSNIKVTNVAVDTTGVSSNVQNAQSQATF